MFSGLSIKLYIYLEHIKGKETVFIKPLDDIVVFYMICWFFIFFSLLFFIKHFYVRKGIYLTLGVHFVLLIVFLFYISAKYE